MTALAPATVQRIPDCFSRAPTTVLQLGASQSGPHGYRRALAWKPALLAVSKSKGRHGKVRAWPE